MAIEFNGSNQHILLSNSAALSPAAGSLSISAWILSDDINPTENKWVYGDYGGGHGGSKNEFILLIQDGATDYFAFGVRDKNGNIAKAESSTYPAAVATRYHVVGVWNTSNNTAYLYIDAVLDDSHQNNNVGNVDTEDSSSPVIGAYPVDPSTLGWDGKIEDVRVFDRVLTQKEISLLTAGYRGPIGDEVLWLPMNEARSDLLDSMEAYWKLDEESGGRVDSHGSNDLTDQNTVLFDTGKIVNAADFEKDNSEYLRIADNASLSFGNEDVTWAGWLKMETKVSTMDWIGKRVGGGGELDYNLLYLNSSDRMRFGAAGAYVLANTYGSPSLATWMFVICWHNAVADTLSIQINNSNVDSDVTGGAAINDGAGPFAIGAEGDNGDYWDGEIDEVGVWRRRLSVAERTWLYNDGSGRTYSELAGAGLGGFDGRELMSHNLLPDRSANDNDGTPVNAPIGRASKALRYGVIV